LVGVQLRPYQVEAAEAIIRSVFARQGLSFVVIFARQSGKDEMIANLILFLLARLSPIGGSIVCAQPTFRPQTLNAIDRLMSRAAKRPFFEQAGLRRRHGFQFTLGRAVVSYLSADPSASVVGYTADRLLIINEAQDVQPSVFDKRFAPMAAAGNGTIVSLGTAWTEDTLLERQRRLAVQLERQDGVRRVFTVDGPQVAEINELYGRHLEREIAALGRDHPLIRTQYFCENLESRASMFGPSQRALMECDALHQTTPVRGAAPGGGVERAGTIALSGATAGSAVEGQRIYAFLLDVAGQAEASSTVLTRSGEVFDPHSNSARDSVTLRIVQINLSTLSSLRAPTYRAVYLRQWTGENHNIVFGQLKALAESWRPRHIVIDATGVGEGLWAMLDGEFPTRVIPVKFTQAVKSELGYGFLAIINSGRFRDCVPSPETDRQYAACESEILIGPRKTMRWGVPDGRRDADGRLIHDDIPVTDSLTAVLDRLKWSVPSPTLIVRPVDPLDEMSHFRE
jgi:hypothetical protein